MSIVLLDIALIVLAAKIAGAAARRIGQPAVVGEISVGILLGPTLFGGAVTRAVLPADVQEALGAMAAIGLVLFMFSVGFELDHRLLRGRIRAATAIAAGSTLVPFALGCGAAVWWVATHEQAADPVLFVLFLGAAMSVTALPVLARILVDRGLSRTRIGGLAIASATVTDVAVWTLLAVIVALAGGGAPWQLLLVVPYVLLMMVGVRKLLVATLPRWTGRGGFTVVVAGLFGSAAATEWLGMHYVFGALLFGAILPGRDSSALVTQVAELTRVGGTVLLPVFFVVAAAHVDLSGLGAAGLGELLLILLIAVAGKMGGAYLAARAARQSHRDAATLGVLMNARGITELVALQVGLQIGVLDVRLYSLLVLMALLTTALTGPLLSVVERWTARHPTEPAAPTPIRAELRTHGADRPQRRAS